MKITTQDAIKLIEQRFNPNLSGSKKWSIRSTGTRVVGPMFQS